MQDLSFPLDNLMIHFQGLQFSIQIFTYENVYCLSQNSVFTNKGVNELEVYSQGLLWAGGQEKSPGECHCRLLKSPQDASIRVDIQAIHPEKIRCLKLTLHDQPVSRVLNLQGGAPYDLPDTGMTFNYPEGWRELPTPMLVFDRNAQEKFLYVRSLDKQVREKRITLLPHAERFNIEMIWEEDAIHQTGSVTVPAWEIGFVEDPAAIYADQAQKMAQNFDLHPWETRLDVPDWARKVSLVVSLHMQHYTGYIFNDYPQALEIVQWFASRFPAEKTLFYLPGWEGRYYWQYGDYRPDERMGGESGFAALLEGIHKLGANCMPMFGLNVVNKNSPGFEQWGRPSQKVNASGNVCESSVDWDGSRDYDLGWGAMLNPGAPGWQNRLVEQISVLRERYQFRAAFLDISAAWWNDPNFHVYAGAVELIRRLRAGRSDFLVAGEAWFDAMSACTPFVQCGHTDGRMNWPDIPYEPVFTKYCRAFGHLSLGDPGRGSTGVHELGYNPTWEVPLRKGIIPTITVVDQTLQNGTERIERIIDQAKLYQQEFLSEE